jgi:serine/threonine protein kinase
MSLESASIVHRDIAARNFLVTDNLKVLLSDFGMSKQLEKGDGMYFG